MSGRLLLRFAESRAGCVGIKRHIHRAVSVITAIVMTHNDRNQKYDT